MGCLRTGSRSLLCVVAALVPVGAIAADDGAVPPRPAVTAGPLSAPVVPSPLIDSESSPKTSDEEVAARLRRVEARLQQLEQPAVSSLKSDQNSCHHCGVKDCGGDCWPGLGHKVFDEAEINVTGFFHLDWGLYDQTPRNRATLGDIEDALGFRRARLAATGRVSENTEYILEFDFAQSQPRFVDVWMEFQETAVGDVRIGRFRQPFGMSELTSIRSVPFLERPLQFTLSPFRQTGVMLHDTAWDDSATWAVSGYRYLSDNFGNVYSDTGGYGMATRLTALPFAVGDDRLIHLGFGFSHNDPGRDRVQFVSTNEFVAGQNPALGPAGLSVLPIDAVPPFVNTGEIDTESVSLFNVEGAIANGRWLAQSEVRWAAVEQLDGTRNTFPGAYAHVRYLLTGDTFQYDRSGGVFTGVKPNHPVDRCAGNWGAWELAGRVSHLDLNGDNLPGPGRRLTDLTLGLNWYLNKFVKFQWNYIHSELDDPALGTSHANLFAMRGQLAF